MYKSVLEEVYEMKKFFVRLDNWGIRMKRISLKIVTRLSIIFSVIGLLLVITGICLGATIGLIVLGIGLVELVGTIIFIAVFRRCPHCGSFLKTGCDRYCPHCGKYVNENDYIYF